MSIGGRSQQPWSAPHGPYYMHVVYSRAAIGPQRLEKPGSANTFRTLQLQLPDGMIA